MKKFFVSFQKSATLLVIFGSCFFFLYSISLNNEYSFHIDDTPKKINLRDFYGYECKNIIRMGGSESAVKNAPNTFWRIDGAWFICLDGNLAIEKNKECSVLSFGINYDYSFDLEMQQKYGCHVFSFDPFVEAKIFTDKRKINEELKNSPVLSMDSTWKFYRIGIDGNSDKKYTDVKIGELLNFGELLKYTELENETIDVLKMDIEGAEQSFLAHLNMSYACKYIKQYVLETHPPAGHSKENFKYEDGLYSLMRKLEECFLLFHRDTRFFIGDKHGTPTGHVTEFQNNEGYLLQLKYFENEINLAQFMFNYGELYFVNKNFL